MGVMGTGYPHPAEDWGAWAVWQHRGPRLTSRWQRSSCWSGFSWSGFSWSCPGTGGAQPSPAPGAGPVRPTEGRGGRRALPQSSQMGKLRHEGAAGGDPAPARGPGSAAVCLPHPAGSEQEQGGKILEPSKQRELPLLSCGKQGQGTGLENRDCPGLLDRGHLSPRKHTRPPRWPQPNLRPR